MKKRTVKKILAKLLIIVAVCLLCYPAIAEIYNKYHASYVISNYHNSVNEINEEDYSNYLEKARIYNESLVNNKLRYVLSKKDMEEYMSLLNVSGNGIIGVVSIRKINVKLPIYHTTNDDVLQVATGHVPGSSLPVGGESTHSIISGHRGMASAALFTDLPKLEIGDTFNILVLNETFTYEVDQIETVLPDEMELLEIVDGEDYCTLVTCTPLGVNSHRILIRGHRTETIEEPKEETSIVKEIVKGNVLAKYEIIMFCIAMFLLIIGVIIPIIRKWLKNKKGDGK